MEILIGVFYTFCLIRVSLLVRLARSIRSIIFNSTITDEILGMDARVAAFGQKIKINKKLIMKLTTII